MVVGPAPAAAPGAGRSVHGGPGVFDGFVHGDDEAGGLGGGRQRVDAHDGRFPHAGLEVVGDVLVVDVHAVPHPALGGDKRVSVLRWLGLGGQQRHLNIQGEAEMGPCSVTEEYLKGNEENKPPKNLFCQQMVPIKLQETGDA